MALIVSNFTQFFNGSGSDVNLLELKYSHQLKNEKTNKFEENLRNIQVF